jgi:hypothetical protein
MLSCTAPTFAIYGWCYISNPAKLNQQVSRGFRLNGISTLTISLVDEAVIEELAPPTFPIAQ